MTAAVNRPCDCNRTPSPPGAAFVRGEHCGRCTLWERGLFGQGEWAAPVSPAALPPAGPGTELKGLLAELGFADAAACGCASKAAQMDAWGVPGCLARRGEIEGWLREQAAARGWWETLRAAAAAVRTGLALKLHPLDPAPGLLDEAVRRAAAKAPPVPAPDPPPGAGVVVGTYGLPQLARLQVLLVRETCGAVPILFADDGAELAHPGTDAAFLALCAEFPGVTYWPSAERRGHYAGDLSVFWKGLQWADRLGLRWVCKLSQWFLWTRPGWLADAVRGLDGAGLAAMYQGCIDAGVDLYVRSECVLLDAAAWGPLWREFDRPRLHNATEFYVNGLVHRHFGGQFHRWAELPRVREVRPRPGAFVWHTCHGDADYAALHARYGVEPDRRGGSQSMTAAGWMSVPGWKKG